MNSRSRWRWTQHPSSAPELPSIRALKHAGVSRGQRLGVFGIGGLGHIAVQISREVGAEVTAIDISQEKLDRTKSLGASSTLNAAAVDVVKELRGRDGVHVALVTSAGKSAYEMAFYCLRPTGILLAVGLPADNICFPPIVMAAGEVRIQTAAVCTRQDLREILVMAAAGKVRCQVTSRRLFQANEVLEELRRGQIPSWRYH